MASTASRLYLRGNLPTRMNRLFFPFKLFLAFFFSFSFWMRLRTYVKGCLRPSVIRFAGRLVSTSVKLLLTWPITPMMRPHAWWSDCKMGWFMTRSFWLLGFVRSNMRTHRWPYSLSSLSAVDTAVEKSMFRNRNSFIFSCLCFSLFCLASMEEITQKLSSSLSSFSLSKRPF